MEAEEERPAVLGFFAFGEEDEGHFEAHGFDGAWAEWSGARVAAEGFEGGGGGEEFIEAGGGCAGAGGVDEGWEEGVGCGAGEGRAGGRSAAVGGWFGEPCVQGVILGFCCGGGEGLGGSGEEQQGAK